MKPVKIFRLLPSAYLIVVLVSTAQAAANGAIVKGTITSAGKPVTDAVVSLEGVAQEPIKAAVAAQGPKKAVMDQRNMTFLPRVLPVLVGSTVEFPNNDNTFHNVYSKGGALDFDLGLYPAGKMRSAKFDKPGVARILCNAHPAMEAFIVVKEHPYFSAVDSRGNYQINNAPLGKYRVQVWHPQLGTSEAGIHLVREGEVLDINLELKKK